MDKTMNEIVMYNNQPALVINYNKGGQTVSLKLGPRHFATVLTSAIQPYNGPQDAVSLGFKSAD